jgi:hypothetical protein
MLEIDELCLQVGCAPEQHSVEVRMVPISRSMKGYESGTYGTGAAW